ncbi:YozQ family protein [Ectobacillus funiculus]|uniref:YozQ family protein n=1 Tax=Ectobacillus funiculus TaxID=137993 RepID=A0ABV5WHN8_9BACI
MANKQQDDLQTQSSNISDKQYDPTDYKKNDSLSQSFAVTHEQVSDTYTAGTVDGAIENVAGKDVKLERKGYDLKKM